MPFRPFLAVRTVPAVFISDRPLAECIERLEARVDPFAPQPPELARAEIGTTAAARRVLGTVDGGHVRLHIAVPLPFTFTRTFYGRFGSQQGKTVLDGQFRVDPWIRAAVAGWLFLIVFAGVIFAADLLIGTERLSARVARFAVYAGFALIGGAYMRLMQRSDVAVIETIRREILDALE